MGNNIGNVFTSFKYTNKLNLADEIQSLWKIRFSIMALNFVRKFLFFFIKIIFPKIDSSKHSVIIPKASYSPWLIDKSFKETYKLLARFTHLDEFRMFELWKLVEQVKKIEGEIIEIGVWRGGSGCLIARKCKLEKIPDTVYLCDTFEGVVKAGEHDDFYKGKEHANTSKEIVEDLIDQISLDNTKILKGVFPDETSDIVKNSRFRLCHIDVDSYQSGKDILDWIWDKISLHGIIVWDDYGDFVSGGITKLVEEELTKKDRIVIHNLNGHALMIKIA